MWQKIQPLSLGVILTLVIACCAQWVESLLPIHLIGSSVIALFIGMTLNRLMDVAPYKAGIAFTSKKILKFAIVLLGASLNVQTILTVGSLSLTVMLFTLFTCFGGGYFIGKALGLDWKLSNLISAGTGICGGSAIAAIAPVIDAEDSQIAYAMSATFLFDMFMILAFPFMGHALGLSDMAYGLWTGTAVNDTSSVVAAGYAYSEGAGDFATMVKLTRTLSIIPTVLVFAFINHRITVKTPSSNPPSMGEKPSRVAVLHLFPWFILGFLVLASLNSFQLLPLVFTSTAKDLSKFLMVAALAAIGLLTDSRKMKQAGIAPMIHGFIISALVVVVALGVEWWMGLV